MDVAGAVSDDHVWADTHQVLGQQFGVQPLKQYEIGAADRSACCGFTITYRVGGGCEDCDLRTPPRVLDQRPAGPEFRIVGVTHDRHDRGCGHQSPSSSMMSVGFGSAALGRPVGDDGGSSSASSLIMSRHLRASRGLGGPG
ncbi:hypothetical protein F4553_008086 [Allocatelliglobosispora scoriae]|uniref:Uncharacterized protein n=1 Tax=Allocatelliglobosispora scoriae TaxID=643052 RepID=A0A841C6D7_9ACTN|nr:hypothetical protein [Allocatelliglobosispora scoriae]MBB5874652.1 hypothetical protein [Allocatelliglobosispora scoriae]